jgi:hypothetical protein
MRALRVMLAPPASGRWCSAPSEGEREEGKMRRCVGSRRRERGAGHRQGGRRCLERELRRTGRWPIGGRESGCAGGQGDSRRAACCRRRAAPPCSCPRLPGHSASARPPDLPLDLHAHVVHRRMGQGRRGEGEARPRQRRGPPPCFFLALSVHGLCSWNRGRRRRRGRGGGTGRERDREERMTCGVHGWVVGME